jgi:hypothetical protein
VYAIALVRTHVSRHHGLRPNRRAVADDDVAQHRRAGAERDAVADLFRRGPSHRLAALAPPTRLWVPVAALLSRAAERDGVEDGAVVPDDRRLADDDARGVVLGVESEVLETRPFPRSRHHHPRTTPSAHHEEAAAELRVWVDVDAPQLAHAVLDGQRDVLARERPLCPKLARDALRLHAVEALEEHYSLQEPRETGGPSEGKSDGLAPWDRVSRGSGRALGLAGAAAGEMAAGSRSMIASTSAPGRGSSFKARWHAALSSPRGSMMPVVARERRQEIISEMASMRVSLSRI